MANFCVKCGNALPPDARFCPGCGAPAPGVSGGNQMGSPPDGPGVAGSPAGGQSSPFQQVPPIPPHQQVSTQSLDIFFYVPIGVCVFLGLVSVMFMGTLMKYGKGGAALFFILLDFGLAALIWKWPYQQYKRGNLKEARKGAMVFAGLSVLLTIFAIGTGQMFTALLDLAALGSFLYLFYKLGNNSLSV